MLVQVQTLRGTQGTQAAQNAVTAAVNAYNGTNGTTHTIEYFVALPPNTKGMQVHLSLWAALARLHGCTLVRLSVHNGNVALIGPAANIANVQAAYGPTYNAIATAAANAYTP